jgi:hypothetical protein
MGHCRKSYQEAVIRSKRNRGKIRNTKDKRQELARPLGHPDYGAQVGPATKIQTEKAGHGSIAPPKTLLLDSSIGNIAPDG